MSETPDCPLPGNAPANRVAPADHETGLPGLRSWRTVYIVVLWVFILWVALLTWLTKYYTA